jgi:hypothetical protein
MSSVTRFLRQIPTGVGQLNGTFSGSSVLDFIPTSGNYVGNYPPGYIVPGTVTGLSSAVADALNGTGQAVVRDMGKTIFCPYAATVGGAQTQSGFFRQYQLLMVTPITNSQGFIGGVNGNNFGVVGPSSATVPGTSTYVTFYLPTLVAGVGAPVNASDLATDIGAGGQM